MKRASFPICFIAFLVILTLGCNRDERSVREKLAHEIFTNVTRKLYYRYNLYYVGITEGANETYYKKIGLSFQIYRVLSKEEGRKMLIDCVEELLKEINSNFDFQEYLNPYPFTTNNVEIDIFVATPDRKKVFYPEICIFEASRNKIGYFTKIPEMKYGYYTEEEESYEDALKIVKADYL